MIVEYRAAMNLKSDTVFRIAKGMMNQLIAKKRARIDGVTSGSIR